jgi:hypothetical protein
MEFAKARLRKAVYESNQAVKLLRDAEMQSEMTDSPNKPNRILAYMQHKYTTATNEVLNASKTFGSYFKEKNQKIAQREICESMFSSAWKRKSDAEREMMNETAAMEKTQSRIAYLEKGLKIQREKLLKHEEFIAAKEKIVEDAVLDVNVSDTMMNAIA